jgi:predicted dehydrogenase
VIGIALLGASYAARVQLTGWKRVPNARVVGIWNRTAGRGQALAAEHGVASFASLDELLSHREVNAVDVATGLSSHLELTRAAAAAGKHVLCQKPMAPTFDDCADLLAACTASGVRLMVNENWRWRSWYRAVRTLLDRGELGQPFYLRMSHRIPAALVTPEQPADRIFEREAYLRGERRLILVSMGPHYVDTVRFLFGDPGSVYARVHKVTNNVAGEEVATLMLAYPDRTATIEMSWATVADAPSLQPDRLTIEGTEATLTLGDDAQIHLRRRDGRQEIVPVDTVDGYQRSWTDALAHFASCLERGTEFETHGAHALGTMRIVFGAYHSATTGRAVTLDGELDLPDA